MAVRAKFTVTEIHQNAWNREGRKIILQPVYDTSIPEDVRFSQYTPSGRLEMDVTNPAVVEQFPMGKAFYLDFAPVDDEAAS